MEDGGFFKRFFKRVQINLNHEESNLNFFISFYLHVCTFTVMYAHYTTNRYIRGWLEWRNCGGFR